MKKRIALIITALILVALTASFFVTINTQQQVIIHSSLLNTVKTLGSPTQWQKWHPALSSVCSSNNACSVSTDSASRTFTIQSPETNFSVINQGLSFAVTQTTGNSTVMYSYNTIPLGRDDSIRVIVIGQKKLIQSLLPFLDNTPSQVAAVDSLKSFIETPEKFYGFRIEKRTVVDTVVVITQHTFPVKDRSTELLAMYKKMNNYITANHLTVTQPYIAHYYLKNNDSVEVMTGIPVNKVAAGQNGISVAQMPKGNMLTGYYKGNYAGRAALYRAMDAYLRDHFMQKVASTYEKYLNNKLPANDSSVVEMEINYPIY